MSLENVKVGDFIFIKVKVTKIKDIVGVNYPIYCKDINSSFTKEGKYFLDGKKVAFSTQDIKFKNKTK